jgi:hypothetical protein
MCPAVGARYDGGNSCLVPAVLPSQAEIRHELRGACMGRLEEFCRERPYCSRLASAHSRIDGTNAQALSKVGK